MLESGRHPTAVPRPTLTTGRSNTTGRACVRRTRTPPQIRPSDDMARGELRWPSSFDLVVVGGGPGGYVAAIRAAQLGMKTARRRARASRRHLPELGLHPDQGAAAHGRDLPPAAPSSKSSASARRTSRFDIGKIVARSRQVASQLSRGVAHLMKKNKVTVLRRRRRKLAGKGKLAVAQGRQAGRRARREAHHPRDRRAGAHAARARARRQADLDLQGSDGAGGDAEVAAGRRLGRDRHRVRQLLPHLGAEVTVVEVLDRVLPVEDEEISAFARKAFEKQGMKIHTGADGEGARSTAHGIVTAHDRGRTARRRRRRSSA